MNMSIAHPRPRARGVAQSGEWSTSGVGGSARAVPGHMGGEMGDGRPNT